MTVTTLSPSSIAVFKECRRKYYLQYVRRLGPDPRLTNPTGVAELGTRVHLALEAWYAHGIAPLDALDAAYDLAVRERTLYAKALRDEQAWARAMVEGYMEWIAEEGLDEVVRPVALEKTVAHALLLDDGDQVVVTGKIDQLVEDLNDGSIFILDHKTVGTFDKANNLYQNEQMLTYAVLVSLSLKEAPVNGHERVAGAYFNMIKRSKRTDRATGPFYRRDRVRYSKHQLNAMYHRLREEASEIERMRRRIEAGEDHRTVAYPTPGPHCSWGCPFQAVCPLFDDGSRAEDAIRSQYVEIDPWGYRSSSPMDRVRDMLKPPPEKS